MDNNIESIIDSTMLDMNGFCEKLSDFGVYNKNLAKLIGVDATVYLVNIVQDNSCWFGSSTETIDMIMNRRSFQSKTSLYKNVQILVEDFLKFFDVIEDIRCGEDSSVHVIFNRKNLENILTLKSDRLDIDKYIEHKKEEIEKQSDVPKKKGRGKGNTAESLKGLIRTNNPELKNMYYMWIDSVISKLRWMSELSVKKGQDIVDSFSNYNLDIALDVVEIAALNGYRQMEFAVKRYTETRGMNTNKLQPSTQSDKDFKGISTDAVSKEGF